MGDTTATITSKAVGLPDEVRRELFSFDTQQRYQSITKKHGIDTSQVREIGIYVLRMLEGVFPVDQFPKELQNALAIDEAKAHAVARSVAEDVLMRFDSDIEEIDFQALIHKWTVEEQTEDEKNPAEFVHTYVATLPGKPSARGQHRLEEVFEDVIEKKVDHDQAKAKLMKPLKVGGLGVDGAAAEKLVSTFEGDIKGMVFEEKVEIAKGLLLKKGVATGHKALVRKGKMDSFSDEDAEEIERVKAQKVAALAHEPLRSIEDVIKHVCEGKVFSFDNPMLTERCQKIVESRVRGVRDARGMRNQLERSVEKGGLGVVGRQLSDMTDVIESAVREYEAHAEGALAKERAVSREQRIAKRVLRDGRGAREKVELDQRFQQLTGNKHGKTAKPQDILNFDEDKLINVDKMRGAIEGADAKRPSARRKAKKPGRVDDIKFAKRLSGPTEELSRLTLTDFRRLSKDPVQASTKIVDKIDLLENQGYELKVRGIKAWRESPLNRRYITLTERAVLGGMTLQQALEETQGEGDEALSEEELRVLMKLNASLRF
jgi:hypothetical protein